MARFGRTPRVFVLRCIHALAARRVVNSRLPLSTGGQGSRLADVLRRGQLLMLGDVAGCCWHQGMYATVDGEDEECDGFGTYGVVQEITARNMRL